MLHWRHVSPPKTLSFCEEEEEEEDFFMYEKKKKKKKKRRKEKKRKTLGLNRENDQILENDVVLQRQRRRYRKMKSCFVDEVQPWAHAAGLSLVGLQHPQSYLLAHKSFLIFFFLHQQRELVELWILIAG